MKTKISINKCIVIFLTANIIGYNAFLHGLGSIELNKENISSDIDNRIIGGTYASLGQFPYQVSMQLYSQHICGGSIFNNNTVLTAAHCCKAVSDYGAIASDVKVVAGLNKLRNEFESNQKYKEETFVKEMTIHPNYTGMNDNFQNDICILHLEDQFNLGSMIAKIPLWKNDSQLEGTKCIISGWGTTRESGSSSNTLQFTEVEILDSDACSNPYNHMTGHHLFYPQNMLCAGLDQGGADSCQGDSGGPLSCNGKLTGIVSFGIGCGRPMYPGIYTKVEKYTSWIESLTIHTNSYFSTPMPRENSSSSTEEENSSFKSSTLSSGFKIDGENGSDKSSICITFSTLFMLFSTNFVARVIL